jgi:hypothetical protein
MSDITAKAVKNEGDEKPYHNKYCILENQAKLEQKKDGTKTIFYLLEQKVSYFEKSGKDK